MNYDYSALINLALVTIIYSSFIAPNLKKMGDLKDEIANTDFPVIDDSTAEKKKATNAAIDQNGTLLDKKLTQYEDKHHDIKVFLYFFYVILVIIFGIQIGLMVYANSFPVSQVVSLSGAALVILLLIITINIYMTAPWKLRSFRWLAKKGVAVVYTTRLLKAELFLNGSTGNELTKRRKSMTFHIRQRAKFVGYHYILMIEGVSSNRLYYVAAGIVGKNTLLTPLAYPNGEVGYDYNIARTYLKDGSYKARLFVFNAPYGGNYKVAETTLDFNVADGVAESESELAVFETSTSDYEFHSTLGISNFKIINILFDESFEGNENILLLLSSVRFRKLMNRLRRPFMMVSSNGSLDRYELEKRISRYSVFRSRIKRVATFKKRTATYHLSK